MLIKAGNPDEATQLLESEALPRMVDAGRLAQAAKLHDEVAKIFEDEHAFPQAIEHYGKACDLFSAENSASTAAKSKQNVARLCAMLDPPDYARSSETYAECGMDAMASQLLKFGAKDLFARAVFCTLARNDLVTAQQQFDKFKEQDFTLEGERKGGGAAQRAPAHACTHALHAHKHAAPHANTHTHTPTTTPLSLPVASTGSREGKLLTDLIKAFENQNGDAFADALFQYNSISALDSWKVSVLRAAKDHLAEPEAAGSAAAGADDESSLM
jgi:alpha-soluble NSF attachment protein